MKNVLKYWYFIFIIPALIFGLLKVYKMIKTEPKKDSEITANEVLKNLGIGSIISEKYKSIARQLGHHLGTSYGWWNYKNWTENDKEVFSLLKDVNQSDFNIISELYTQVYSKGNNLKNDLLKLLDSAYYEQLKIK